MMPIIWSLMISDEADVNQKPIRPQKEYDVASLASQGFP
jgi:hypothetical protein